MYARCINIETLFSLGIGEEIGQIISNNGALEKLLRGCKKGGLGMWSPLMLMMQLHLQILIYGTLLLLSEA